MKDKPIFYIIDNNPAASQALSWLLESALGCSTSIFKNGQIFLDKFKPNTYGCIVLDILVSDMDGLTLLKTLNEKNNKTPVIILTGSEDLSLAIKAMQLGAKDFLTKPVYAQVLLDKINEVLIPYEQQYVTRQSYLNLYSTLTTREREIMAKIIGGKLSKQIATELNISLKTVELHRYNIMHKLQVHNIAELIHFDYVLRDK